MKKNKIKDAFLGELRRIPIIQVACEKTSISRNSVYRWKKEDKEFCNEMEAALVEGEGLVNDISENQILSLIRDKNFPALQLWLKCHHPKYGNKVEVNGSLKIENEPMTPEEQSLVEQALQLAGLENNQETNQKNEPTESSS